MRKVPVLTMVSLVVIAGLMVVPVHAGTVVANDTPDFILAPGNPSSVDLANFFDTEGPEALSYSATGSASVSGSEATINNSGTAGDTSAASFTGTSGADSATVESQVHVSSFVIGNGPAIDNNNRWAGVAGDNIFYNGIAPGETVNSAVNLSNIPEGNGTHGGGTHGGGAATIASIASIDMNIASTGLRQVSRTVSNMGAGQASAGGLTATLNADGSYMLAAGNNFSGAWLVTLGASSGGSYSGVSMLAAAAQNVSTANAADFLVLPVQENPAATTTIDANGITIAGGVDAGALVIRSAGISVPAGEAVTISADYNTNNVPGSLALLAFDGAIGTSVSYTQKIGATNIQAGATKNIATTFVSQSGMVFPGVQVVSAAAGTSITISNLKVISAGSVADYAFDPNATAYANDLSSVAGFGPVGGAVGPGTSPENNFVSINGSGSMLLDGVANPVANALVAANVDPGSAIAECYALRSGAATAGSAVALVLTGDGSSNDASFTEGTLISDTDWTKLTASGTYTTAASMFLVVQAAGGVNVSIDDLVVRQVDDPVGATDLGLLGL